MSSKVSKRFALVAVAMAAGVLVALLVSSAPAMAQCAMCKNAITGSPNAARLAERFNFAIFVLLIPPVLIFCGFFIAVLKYRKEQGDEPLHEHRAKRLLRVWLNRLGIGGGRRELKRRETDGAQEV